MYGIFTKPNVENNYVNYINIWWNFLIFFRIANKLVPLKQIYYIIIFKEI